MARDRAAAAVMDWVAVARDWAVAVARDWAAAAARDWAAAAERDWAAAAARDWVVAAARDWVAAAQGLATVVGGLAAEDFAPAEGGEGQRMGMADMADSGYSMGALEKAVVMGVVEGARRVASTLREVAASAVVVAAGTGVAAPAAGG